MINENFKTTLIKIAKILKENSINWILIGTVGQNLQGLQRAPKDIDIIVKLEKLKKVKNLFLKYNPSDFKTSEMGDFEIEFKIKDVSIEIIGEEHAAEYFENNITFKQLGDMKVPCRNLKKELEMYKKLNRQKRVEELQKFLD